MDRHPVHRGQQVKQWLAEHTDEIVANVALSGGYKNLVAFAEALEKLAAQIRVTSAEIKAREGLFEAAKNEID